MIDEAARAGLTILFGALAGGLTNTVAIWMLFHPYKPPRVLGRPLNRLQGAIPKNKERLAATLGRTVGTQLLTPTDLARSLSAPAFREAFDDRLRAFIAAALERDRGALSEELPAPLFDEIRHLLHDSATELAGRLDGYIAGDEFAAAALGWATSLSGALADRHLSELLTPEREEALAASLERWIGEGVSSEGFESAIGQSIERAAERWLSAERTLEELLPRRLVSALEKALVAQVPAALDRLGKVLEDPAARARLESAIHDVLDRFIRDLRFHQRVVAALLITPDTVERVIHAVESEGTAKIAEVLQEPAARAAITRAVTEASRDLLRRPLGDVIGRAGDPAVEDAKATLKRWILDLARDTGTRAFLVERGRAAWEAAAGRSWNDIFARLSPDRIGDLVVAAARSPEARAVYGEALHRLADGALERRIGRPADHLPADAADRIERALSEPLWLWLQEQVPPIAERVDIAGRVEDKILEYPIDRLEALIRGVTQRELQLIVRLGYVLGGFIGLVLVAVNLVLG